jgi:hypothetical protein
MHLKFLGNILDLIGKKELKSISKVNNSNSLIEGEKFNQIMKKLF